MSTEYIKINLSKEEKEAILKYSPFVNIDEITEADLLNNRVKWVRFSPTTLAAAIGDLTYQFNRCKSNYTFYFLDELICHLESFE